MAQRASQTSQAQFKSAGVRAASQAPDSGSGVSEPAEQGFVGVVPNPAGAALAKLCCHDGGPSDHDALTAE